MRFANSDTIQHKITSFRCKNLSRGEHYFRLKVCGWRVCFRMRRGWASGWGGRKQEENIRLTNMQADHDDDYLLGVWLLIDLHEILHEVWPHYCQTKLSFVDYLVCGENSLSSYLSENSHLLRIWLFFQPCSIIDHISWLNYYREIFFGHSCSALIATGQALVQPGDARLCFCPDQLTWYCQKSWFTHKYVTIQRVLE